MAKITPRIRLLITAPLALLLPAGLLTYLGLLMVSGVEMRYLERADEIVKRTVHSVRNRTWDKLQTDVLKPFQNTVQEHITTLLPSSHTVLNSSFTLTKTLPFVSRIFVCDSKGKIHFFERESEDKTKQSHQWIYYENPKTNFVAWLNYYLELELKNTSEEQHQLIENRVIPYPDEQYPASQDRELVSFILIERDIRKHFWIDVVGFTFDFTYLNKTFFSECIERMYDMYDIQYPIYIEDYVTGQRVAEVPQQGNIQKESKRYIPRVFNPVHLPWYQIHFSPETGSDVMDIANYEKNVYYCLIAAANVIMILGVLSSIRNVNRELTLAEMRSDFVARVSHELRTPLGLIRLFAETLEMGRMKNETKQKEYLHAITKESERLTLLINNILDFSKIEENKKHYTVTEAQAEEIILNSVDIMQYHLQRNEMKVELDIEPNLPPISCDPEAVQQALYNLLSNAMKYSDEGKTIEMKASRRDHEVVISVKDEGIGISSEDQEKIFQKFYRVDNPKVRKTGGSGLGLSVVNHIIENQGGTITVHSELNRGSVFSLHFPILQKKQKWLKRRGIS